MIASRSAAAHAVRRHWVGAVLLVLSIPALADAVQVVVTLDGIPATACNETWTESGVVLRLVATESEDCDGGGNCLFGVGAADVDLFPGRLSLDLTGLGGPVTSAEVDVDDFCGVACTRAFLYQGTTQVDSASNPSGGTHTLALSAGGSAVDRLAVSSCEGSAREIRLEVGAPIPAVPSLSPTGLFALTLCLFAGAAIVLPRLQAVANKQPGAHEAP